MRPRNPFAKNVLGVIITWAMLISLVALPHANAETFYIDSRQSERGDGTMQSPYRSWDSATLQSGNRYLFRRGGIYRAPIEIGGVENIEIGAWGEGADPLIDGGNSAPYGIRIFSTRNIIVTGLHLAQVNGACIVLVGSAEYQIRGNHCHTARFGIIVNAGKLGPRGTIENNLVHGVGGDGIGAWDLAPGAVIRYNHIYDFGNDGIDILGSWEAVVENNVVHDSTDRPEIDRGMVHAGIKAGGRQGKGGGNNAIVGNLVYGVKNYGIWNRGAIGNVYRGNTCYDNGVNFSFVSSEGPAMAVIEDNVARDPSFAAGLRYSVYIPPPSELRSAANNWWQGGLVSVKDVGVINDHRHYMETMAPYEEGTRF